MTEDSVQRDIKDIKFRIEDIQKSQGLLLRARRQEVIDELMKNCFGKSLDKVRVFLDIDGKSSLTEIGTRLEIKLPNVSVIATELEQNDLVEIKDITLGKKIYQKTTAIRRIRLEKYLNDEFKLELEEKSKKLVAEDNIQGSKSSGTIPSS